jgi:flagellar biosynthesis/type III secretory pathway M-ring protein FliF/YscJ
LINKYRDLMVPVSLGLVLLIVITIGVFKVARKPKPGKESVETPEQHILPEGTYTPVPTMPGAEPPAARLDLSPAAQQLSEGDREQLAERIRQVAKRDPAATANVLRMWLQDSQPQPNERT